MLLDWMMNEDISREHVWRVYELKPSSEFLLLRNLYCRKIGPTLDAT